MSAIAPFMNTFGEAADTIFKSTAKSVVPTLSAATVAWILDSNPAEGALLGFLTSSFCSYVITPIEKYVHNHSGEGPNQFNQKAQNLIAVGAMVAQFALPVLITNYCAEKILPHPDSLSPYLSFLVTPPINESSLTMLQGIFISILPVGIQQWIEQEDAKEAKRLNLPENTPNT